MIWLDRLQTLRLDRAALQRSRPGIRIVPTSGGLVRIRHQPSTSGPQILLGTDGPNVIEHYDTLLGHLAGKADVVIFEPPGTGGSASASGFDFRLGSFATVAEELLQTCGPRTLVFPCYLGLVGRVVARRSPHLAPRLVLPQTVSWDDFERWANKVDPKRWLRTCGVGQLLVAVRRRQIARAWYRASVGHKDARAALIATSGRNFDDGGCFCLASLMQGLTPELDDSPTPVPTAVVWGAKDRTHAKSDPSRSVLGAEVVRFDDSGHSPDLEEPARFASWLVGWHR